MNQLLPVMQNDQRILELLAEVLQKVDVLAVEVKGVQGEVKGLKDVVQDLIEDVSVLKEDVSVLKENVEDLKDNVKKLNIISAENSRALLKLADHTERRLSKLEKAVFK